MTRPQPLRPSSLHRATHAISALILAVLATLGCTLSSPTGIPSGTIQPTAVTAPTPTPTIADTPTPPPSKAILIAPAEAQPAIQDLAATLAELAAETGLEFESLQALPSDLRSGRVEIAVILAPVENLDTLAEASPEVRFIAVGLAGLSASANLTVIHPLTERTDDVAFLAGYTAALVSQEWRVASLSQADTAIGGATRIAFANGAAFFCGLCRPSHPPYAGYPLDYAIPTQADTQAIQSALARIEQDRVQLVFIQPGLDDPELNQGLLRAGVRVLGVGGPDPAQASGWVASIEGDLTAGVRAAWLGMTNGQDGEDLRMPLQVVVYDREMLSPGRYDFLRTMLADIEGGFIDTGVDPLTGEAR